MSNLTYNPNVNIPYNNYSNYNNPNMEFNENGGNFRNYNSNYDNDMPSQIPQIDPRANNRIENMNQQYMRQPMKQPIRNQYDYDMDSSKISKRNNKMNYTDSQYNDKTTMDSFEDTKPDRFDWVLFVKKIVIYTALFLIMSHVKMDELVCRFIPFLNDNQILCMTFKGLLLALLIILVQMLL